MRRHWKRHYATVVGGPSRWKISNVRVGIASLLVMLQRCQAKFEINLYVSPFLICFFTFLFHCIGDGVVINLSINYYVSELII